MRGGEKESLCEEPGLCQVLRVSVNESGAGQDGMEDMSSFRKSKREGRIKIITNSSSSPSKLYDVSSHYL